jgi:uncharacterized protein (DUF433 family)
MTIQMEHWIMANLLDRITVNPAQCGGRAARAEI